MSDFQFRRRRKGESPAAYKAEKMAARLQAMRDALAKIEAEQAGAPPSTSMDHARALGEAKQKAILMVRRLSRVDLGGLNVYYNWYAVYRGETLLALFADCAQAEAWALDGPENRGEAILTR